MNTTGAGEADRDVEGEREALIESLESVLATACVQLADLRASLLTSIAFMNRQTA